MPPTYTPLNNTPDCSSSKTALLILISGPSGVGKDAVVTQMRQLGLPFFYTVTTTTRSQRPQEKNGTDYEFVTKQAFKRMVQRNEFLEWALVYGNLYGVPKTPVINALRQGQDVIIKTDVQGVKTIKTIAPQAISIFIAPGDPHDLTKRLTQRMTESSTALELRINTANAELKQASTFDYIIVNQENKLTHTVQQIEKLISKEHEIPRLQSLQILENGSLQQQSKKI